MNALVGLEQIRRKLLKQYTVGDIVPADDWSLDMAVNRAKLMDGLERLDECKGRLFKDTLKGGE